ncbi:zincin [Artomyces pyxidatus]|uniref:Zincin n=1 Tax=Artomyces pyxidatus TaxID=48021 RepID=A0ACB8T068_9AGAM|nr:zincin [Artomyces pyxidatus]
MMHPTTLSVGPLEMPAQAQSVCSQSPQKNKLILHQSGAILGGAPKAPYLWRYGKNLTYFFMDGNDVQRDKVRRLIPLWTAYGLVQFQEVSRAEESLIRITFDGGQEPWSYCEFVEKDKPTMNLGDIDDEQSSSSASERRIILHELGHALGLMHENHAVLRHAVNSSIRRRFLCCMYPRLDTTSIMYFPLPHELTGVSNDGALSDSLSDMDKAYMVINYPRTEPHPDMPEWTLEKALQIAGVPDDDREQILDAQRRADVEYMRLLFFHSVFSATIEQRIEAPDTPPDGPLHRCVAERSVRRWLH